MSAIRLTDHPPGEQRCAYPQHRANRQHDDLSHGVGAGSYLVRTDVPDHKDRCKYQRVNDQDGRYATRELDLLRVQFRLGCAMKAHAKYMLFTADITHSRNNQYHDEADQAAHQDWIKPDGQSNQTQSFKRLGPCIEYEPADNAPESCIGRDALAPDTHQANWPPTGRENCSNEQHEPENVGRKKVTT